MHWRCVITSLRSKLIKGGLSSITTRVLAILSGFLLSVGIVRVLGAEEYGRYAFVLTVVTLLAMPSVLGLPTLVVREIASSGPTKNWGRIRGIRNWSLCLATISSFIFCTSAALFIHAGIISVDAELKPVFLLGFILVPLFAFAEIVDAILRGVHQVFWGQFPNRVMRPLLILTVVVATYYVLQRPVSAFHVVVITIFVLVGVLSLGLLLVRRHLPAAIYTSKARYANSEWLRVLMPLSIISGLQAVYNNTDLLAIGMMVDTTSVGTYRIALSIANVASLGVVAINLVVMPHYASLYEQNDWNKIRKISMYAGLGAFSISCVMTAFLFVFGRPLIVLIYGVDQSGAYWPALLLSLGNAVYGIWASLGGVAMMTGREDRFLKILIGSVVANVVLNFVLIPKYQINGAAIASAISYVLNGILLWIFTKDLLKDL